MQTGAIKLRGIHLADALYLVHQEAPYTLAMLCNSVENQGSEGKSSNSISVVEERSVFIRHSRARVALYVSITHTQSQTHYQTDIQLHNTLYYINTSYTLCNILFLEKLDDGDKDDDEEEERLRVLRSEAAG